MCVCVCVCVIVCALYPSNMVLTEFYTAVVRGGGEPSVCVSVSLHVLSLRKERSQKKKG